MSHKPPKGSPLAKSRVDAARSDGPPVFAIAVGVLAVLLVAAIVVVAVTGLGGDDDEASGDGDGGGAVSENTQAFGPVTATGVPLPEYRGGGDDPAVGEPAPTLTGESPTGEEVVLDPADGPMVLVFLAHWCPHCQAVVPRIVEASDGTDEIEGVRYAAVLTASTPENDNFPPGPWLEREGWSAPAMVDTEEETGSIPVAFSSYGVAGFPFMVAVDADGEVAERTSGEKSEDELRAFFAQVAE